jgi:hypothetical protein
LNLIPWLTLKRGLTFNHMGHLENHVVELDDVMARDVLNVR